MAANQYQYELTYVISGVVQQNQVDDIVRKVNHLVEDNDGDVLEVDEWGNQRLAYEIDRKRSGYYVNMFFKAPGELIPRIERELQINDDVLRYLTLRMDAKMKRHYEKQQKRRARAEEASDAEEGDEGEEESDENDSRDEDVNYEHIEYVDYKEAEDLEQYINNQGKILPRRVTNVPARVQRQITTAIKRARHLALLPYVQESIR